MSNNPPEPTPGTPASKELRDARRQAHQAQKKSTSDKGGDKKSKNGKGDRKPGPARPPPGGVPPRCGHHLALMVPEPATASGIWVGGEVRHWEQGRSLVFDDT